MGLFDNIFGGGNREKTRDESSVQADINKSLKESGGKWTSNLNDLVAERDRARSGATTSSSGRNALSQGLGSFGRAVSSIPGNIARDVKMGTSAGLFSGRDKQAENLKSKGFSQADIKDYFARTDATIARNAAQQDFGRSDRSNDAPFRAPIGGDVDEQAPVYKNPFGSPQNPTISGGKGSRTFQPPEISPEMRREALRIFESQRGAGQVPYQMMPYQQGLGSMPPPQGLSPAFQYAAQNYQRLGGAQRLMDRPMEMMSVAERQRINEMAQGMADSQSRRRLGLQDADLEQIMRGKGGGNPAIPFSQRPTFIPGKGGDRQQSETINRILPFISQMGLASLRGPGMPPPVQGRPER